MNDLASRQHLCQDKEPWDEIALWKSYSVAFLSEHRLSGLWRTVEGLAREVYLTWLLGLYPVTKIITMIPFMWISSAPLFFIKKNQCLTHIPKITLVPQGKVLDDCWKKKLLASVIMVGLFSVMTIYQSKCYYLEKKNTVVVAYCSLIIYLKQWQE